MDIKLSLDRKTLKKKIDKLTEGNTSMNLSELLAQLGANPNELTYSIHEISTMNIKMVSEILYEEIDSSKPDIELIKNIIQHSQIKYLDRPTDYFIDILTWAIYENQIDVVKLLLQQPNIKGVFDNDYYFSDCCEIRAPLVQAVKSRNIEIVKLLLEHPNVNVNNSNNTDGIEWLEYGYETALMVASKNGLTEIVRILLQHPNINVNLLYRGMNSYNCGKAAMRLALDARHHEIVDLIKAHPKFDETLQDEEPETMIKRMKKAMEKKNITKMKLKREYDPNFPRQEAYTPPFTQIRIDDGEVELCPDEEYDEDENSNWTDAKWYLKYSDIETYEDIIEEIEQYGSI